MLQGLHIRTLAMSSVGKGFGKASLSSSSGLLRRTRVQEFHKVTGSYAKLLSKQAKKFEDFKNSGVPVANDLYARLVGEETCWFIGKSIHAPTVTDLAAIDILLPLLQEYAKSLRPKELAGPKATNDLQVLYTKGNSEMDVAQNKVPLTVYASGPDCAVRSFIPSDDVGYEPEIYQNNEEGFRCWRDSQGLPIKAKFEVTYTTDPGTIDTQKE